MSCSVTVCRADVMDRSHVVTLASDVHISCEYATRAQRKRSEVADGAVIGSWLVDQIAREWNSGAGREAIVARIRELKAATRQG